MWCPLSNNFALSKSPKTTFVVFVQSGSRGLLKLLTHEVSFPVYIWNLNMYPEAVLILEKI